MADHITFIYDGKGHRVGIVEKHGSTVLTSKTFVWCDDELREERNSAGTSVTKRFYDRGEQINGTSYYFTNDQIGSIREMTDTSGTIHARYDYDPWGRSTKLSGDLDADFGYTSFYVNKTTGLDLTWYRAYDSEKGRWLSRDPLEESAGLNLYEYAKNNTLVNVDPDGLQVVLVPPITPPTALYDAAVLCALGILAACATKPISCDSNNKKCPPCSPYPVGTIGYRYSTSPGHYPIKGPHYLLYVVGQSPAPTCKCFWSSISKLAVAAPPPGSVPVVPLSP